MALELNNKNVEYKNNKAIIKSLPQNGENLSVFLRPGDEVIFQLEGINAEKLEYLLVGGDIIVSLPGFGSFTFPSLGLMGFSDNAPKLNFGNGKIASIDDIFSHIQEVNELPMESVNANFKIRVNTLDEEKEMMDKKVDPSPSNPIIIVPQNQLSELNEDKKEIFQNSYEQAAKSDVVQDVVTSTAPKNVLYDKPYSRNAKFNDFDAYKPDVEMIPKPDVEMIPKPDVEMIPKPDYETMPKNDFTDYFPDDGSGNGNVSDAAKPVFYFKGTAHQVVQSENVKDTILGGGGSINGGLYDSITNQYESETIDLSNRTKDLLITSENATYFQNNVAEAQTLTFKSLVAGQSVTVNGLTLSATGNISASAVATAFADLSNGATSGNTVANGTWSGTTLSGWTSGTTSNTEVTFTSVTRNADVANLTTTQSGSSILPPDNITSTPLQGDASTTEMHTLTFKDLVAGQSVTVNGLTLNATGNISATAVATAFENLSSSAPSNITNGTWSGTLSNWTSGTASNTEVTFTSITPTSNVADIAFSQSGSTIAVPTAVDILVENQVVDVELSRVLRFEPQMPEGFYVTNFSISGLPNGVTLLDKDGVAIPNDPALGTTIYQDNLIFRDALGNVITPDNANFLTEFKSAEFTIKYQNTISAPFNVSITSNYALDSTYLATTDIDPNQSFTTEYTLAIKDITSADDYTYEKADYIGVDAKDEGFVLAKNPNDTIIKDGSGDSTILGGIVKDIVYDGAGDDAIYLNAGNDTVYAGSGTNYIYGDRQTTDTSLTKITGTDTVNYSTVQSFSASEAQLLENEGLLEDGESEKLSGTSGATSLDQQMLASNKGVYVDLDGVNIPALDIDVNAISKFADREGRFTYDADGNANATTLTNIGLDNLQSIGYDIYEDVENITGSRYDDTLYGNASKNNVLSGESGNDTIDGRGGNNTLSGGDGFDTLIAGTGNDTIDGGADTDTISYQNAAQGMTIRLDRPNGEQYDYASLSTTPTVIKDTITNVEDVIGSSFNDTIYGNGSTNFIQAGGGDDKILAGNGYDFIDGGAGSDWISYLPSDYPDLNDNPSFMQTVQGITTDLNSTDFVMVKETTTSRLIDLVKSIEQINATDGNDVIYGNNSTAEIFYTFGGSDTLWGRGGNDKLYAGDGNDTVRPGAGWDSSDGGAGTDYLELYDDGLLTTQSLRIDDTAGNIGTVQYSTNTTDGVNGDWINGYQTNSGTETAVNFEGFGASNGADKLYGNSQDNTLNGYGGDDTLFGLAGNDTIRGGDGSDTIDGGDGNDILYGERNNDTINAGAGDDTVYAYGRYDTNIENKDTIDGGSGIDKLDYSTTSNALVLNLNTVDINGFATTSFDASTASDKYNDLVKNFETIVGSTGNDTISAAITDSATHTGMTLDGWSGKDYLYGSEENDTVIARNTSGEILEGNGGIDTLQLAQNVDFRNITVSEFETLELGNYYAYFNASQFFTSNSFSDINGGDNSRIYLYAANNSDADTFNFSSIDFTNFTGSIYAYSYNGNDTFDFTGSTLNNTMKLYLDASGGTDTLKLGANQTASMLDNYYNTFEDFDVGVNSTLNINAYNNSGRTLYAESKNFNDVTGDINLIGGTGNDTFYANYEALLAGKLSIDGNAGSDIVDVRTTLPNGSTLSFTDGNVFNDIERLEFDQISSTNTIQIDATKADDWLSVDSDSLVLDLANTNTQANKVSFSNTQATGDTMTGFSINNTYSITPDDNDTFALQVV